MGAGKAERLIQGWLGNLKIRHRRESQAPLFLQEQRNKLALLELPVQGNLAGPTQQYL